MDGFGFVGAMDKLGVERRALTAGENKEFLDPFSPVVPHSSANTRSRCSTRSTQQFIAAVKQGRGARLKETPELFFGPGLERDSAASNSDSPTRSAASTPSRAT